ncbi:MAG: hypothetical protein IM592_17030 [Bacteroidetes bacterium]|nr:hypothetical protein [Bacteroidota bacterium]
MKKSILVALLPLVFTSCYDSELREKEKNLKCDSFDYNDGVIIRSKFKPDSLCKVYVYDKSNITNPKDTFYLKIDGNTNNKNEYSITRPSLNTSYNYKIIINDSLIYSVTDIKSEVYKWGGNFMNGTHYMCQIASYKLNDSLMTEGSNIVITLP